MKPGDLIRVQYPNGVQWWLGIVISKPGDPESVNCIWRMWCIERGTEHVLAPDRDTIEIISSA